MKVWAEALVRMRRNTFLVAKGLLMMTRRELGHSVLHAPAMKVVSMAEYAEGRHHAQKLKFVLSPIMYSLYLSLTQKAENHISFLFLKIKKMRLLFFLLLLCNTIVGQKNIRILSGEVKDVQKGIIYISPALISESFYNKNYIYDSAEIKNGQFELKLQFCDNQIYPYRLYIESNAKTGSTGFVFIDSNELQKIFIDTIDGYVSPVITGSEVQNEIRNTYTPFCYPVFKKIKEFDLLTDSIANVHNSKLPERELSILDSSRNELTDLGDSALLNYMQIRPNSIVGVWKLTERFENFGGKLIYQNIIENHKNSLRSEKIWRDLDSIFNSPYTLFVGKHFPLMDLKTLDGKLITFNPKDKDNLYVLIDFWFSSCKPCIAQFESLKTLYKEYHKYGVEIVSVSIDDSVNIKLWRETIFKYKLPWYNLLDAGGKIANQYGINSFPTSFLVDQYGKVLRVNISPNTLKLYLKSEYINRTYFPFEPFEPK